jgi:hypothetical protein
MNLSRHVLLSLAAIGIRGGLAMAADPETLPPLNPTVTGALEGAPVGNGAPSMLLPPATGNSCEVFPSGGAVVDRSGVIGGVGLYLIQPYFNNNVAFGLQGTENRSAATPASPAGIRFDTRQDITHHMEAAPLVWLGYMSDDGLGFRARYWYFRQGTDQTANGTGPGVNGVMVFSSAPLGLSLINASNGQGSSSMVVTSKLQLQVLDLDTLYEVSACKWNLLFAGGLRLASIDQTYNAYAGNEALLSTSDFSGVGPTVAVEARRALGCTGLSLYGSARGSILFGTSNQTAAIPDRNELARDPRDVGIPVAEAELGLEYHRNVGAAHFLGQIGLLGQQWYGAGSASRSSIDVIPGGAFSSSSYVGDSDIAFFGLFVRLGVNY